MCNGCCHGALTKFSQKMKHEILVYVCEHLLFCRLPEIINLKVSMVVIFHFSSKCFFSPPKASSLRSSTTWPSQNFQNLTFYMTPRHVCEGWSIFWSGTILIKYQLRVEEWGKYWKVLGDRYMFSDDGQFYPSCILFPENEFEYRWSPFV